MTYILDLEVHILVKQKSESLNAVLEWAIRLRRQLPYCFVILLFCFVLQSLRTLLNQDLQSGSSTDNLFLDIIFHQIFMVKQ